MSGKRFHDILRFLRFDDAVSRRQKRSLDKLQPIRECFEMWNSTLKYAFSPGWCVTVDEQLVNFKGRCPFRQYIPSKPGKYGIKLWILCDVETSYIWNTEVYTGKAKNGPRETRQGERVVASLVTELEKSGRNITCDNFFTSLDLARNLLKKKLTIVGTIRKNKGELPVEFTNSKKRTPYTTLFGFKKEAMILSYCPKKGKVVTLLSTMHSQPDIDNSTKELKPEVIRCYNSTKFGVDTMDQMVRCYGIKRKARRWPLVLFYNMIDISAMNAFIIYHTLKPTFFNSKTRRRRQFLIALGKQLTGIDSEDTGAIVSNRSPNHAPAKRARLSKEPAAVTPDTLKKNRCHICPRQEDRKSKTVCVGCQKFVCREHFHVLCHNCHHWFLQFIL